MTFSLHLWYFWYFQYFWYFWPNRKQKSTLNINWPKNIYPEKKLTFPPISATSLFISHKSTSPVPIKNLRKLCQSDSLLTDHKSLWTLFWNGVTEKNIFFLPKMWSWKSWKKIELVSLLLLSKEIGRKAKKKAQLKKLKPVRNNLLHLFSSMEIIFFRWMMEWRRGSTKDMQEWCCGGGSVVGSVGSQLRGLEFVSCFIQTFSRKPAFLKLVWCQCTWKKVKI